MALWERKRRNDHAPPQVVYLAKTPAEGLHNVWCPEPGLAFKRAVDL